MRPLPAAPFDACDQETGRVSSQSLVRYKTNDYSVPVAYGHQDVWIRGYIHEVVIGCRGEVIARHPRCWDRDEIVFDPLHYLPLIEQKINALDQAAPLQDWDLPEEFATLRRLPASTAAIGTLTVPIVGVVAAATMLGEPLGGREILAAALTLGGVALVVARR